MNLNNLGQHRRARSLRSVAASYYATTTDEVVRIVFINHQI